MRIVKLNRSLVFFFKHSVWRISWAVLLAFVCSGCALRVGVKPDRRVTVGSYPPGLQGKAVNVLCVPCFEFDRLSLGLMFIGPWPVLMAFDNE